MYLEFVWLLIVCVVIGNLIGSAVALVVYIELLARSERFVRWMKKATERYVTKLTIVLEEDDE